MTTWEYRLELLETRMREDDREDAEARLDALGTEGWEAVAMVPSTASRHGLTEVETASLVVLLKRPRSAGRSG
ncbi:MAG: hypothetical protein M5U14_17870 [Acidimicrobiia bacterium]|nr:hypothetical protein [Acidimicrobiia bacterium]